MRCQRNVTRNNKIACDKAIKRPDDDDYDDDVRTFLKSTNCATASSRRTAAGFTERLSKENIKRRPHIYSVTPLQGSLRCRFKTSASEKLIYEHLITLKNRPLAVYPLGRRRALARMIWNLSNVQYNELIRDQPVGMFQFSFNKGTLSAWFCSLFYFIFTFLCCSTCFCM